jgi:hypothetical protein
MAGYKINGYDLYLGFGIQPDGDRTTADSFEKPNDVMEVEKYQWAEGILEFDLEAPVVLVPKVITIKGTMFVDTIEDYIATKLAISTILYGSYVTLEMVDLAIKINARIKPGGNTWHRLTHLVAGKIAVQVQFQFDEILQPAPYIDHGDEEIIYYIDNQGNYYLTENNNNYIK